MINRPVPQLARLTLGQETLDLDYFLTREFDDVAQIAEELPAAICWLNYKRSEAIQWELITERQWKEAEATAYFELRNGGFEDKNYGGKATDKALVLAVRLEPLVQAAAKKYESKRAMRIRIEGVIESLQARMDLVRTSEATRRRLVNAPPSENELDGNPGIDPEDDSK